MHRRVWLLGIVVALLSVAVACSSDDTPLVPTATRTIATTTTSASSTPVPQTQTSSITNSTATPAPTSSGDATSVEEESSTIIDERFIHSGFRSQVSRSVEVTDVPTEIAGRTLVVGLRNLSRPSGSFQTRATINFSREFDNYIEVPTNSGLLRLHLHRDGTLQRDADGGGFT